jgi:D-alanyl-D-alanine-carboxypeptidase/D-alanyl-D-alanine-endopeptidase
MKNCRISIIAALSIAFATALPLPAGAQFPSDSAVHAIIKQRVDNRRAPGIVVGLLEPDGTTRVVAYNERAHGEPVFDARTIFEIGSITKAFTGALLADMVARAEVKLDDPVAKFLPPTVRMPTRGAKQITLLDLATQSSALPRMPSNMRPANAANPYADYTVDQLYEFLSGHELRRDIGTQYEYSNLGVGLLGHVLALRAGKSYEALMRERILAPLGMNNTTITLTPQHRALLAPGHNAGGDTVSNWDLPTFAGAGALRSNIEDMLKFLRANLQPSSNNAPRIHDAFVARRPAGNNMEIGLGWHIMNRPDRKIVWHNGGTGGYRTFAGFDPASRRGVVVLTNTSEGHDDIGFHLLDNSLPLAALTARVQRTAIDVAADVLQRYVGEYELTPAVKMVLTVTDGALFGALTGQGAIRLWPESPTDFFLKEVDAQIKFNTSAAGAVESLTLFQNGRTVTARKVR